MTHDELRVILIEQITTIAPDIDAANFDPNAKLRDDYDMDSMDSLNLASAIHKRLQVSIPETDFGKLQTLNDLMSYLEKRISLNG
ncbi:MAG TPA: phosphopantetheine-binding protein [Pseudomonadales bacterium]|nr:phosphopantetheine-binding protein [Pseudomonadales bacterium]